MKKLCFVFSFMLILSSALIAQCGCKYRVIRVYDFSISLPAITEYDTLQIQNYYSALKVASAVADYLRAKDPSHVCMVVRGGETAGALTYDQAKTNWRALGQMASSQTHSPGGSGSEEYYITGSVSGDDQYLYYGFSLYAKNGEFVTSASDQVPTASFYPDLINIAVSVTMMNQVGQLYNKIFDWEVEKRDSGEPYALVYPDMQITPEKTVLEVGEKVKINIKLLDCDGEPLKDRKIDVSTGHGIVTPQSITLDGNGEASVEYDPQSNTGMASIKFSMEFLYPWAPEAEKQMYSPQTSITINKPQDSWWLLGKKRYDESKYYSNTITYGISDHGDSFIREECYFFAWIKLDKHIVGFDSKDTAFVTPTKEPVAIRYFGSQSAFGGGNGFYAFEGGYIKDESNFSTNVTQVNYASPEIYVSLDNGKPGDTYSFTFTGLDGYRSGRFHSTRESNIGGQTTTEVENTEADTSAAFDWSMHDAMYDTTYSTHSSDDINQKTTSVTQTIKWKDQKIFEVVQEKHINSETEYEGDGLTSKEKRIQDFFLEVYLYYGRKPTDPADIKDPFAAIPEEYSLSQNYPNPFNPFTSFSYTLPEMSQVTIKVYDILGKEVQTLTDELKSAGKYDVFWNAENLPSGVYLYELRAGDFTAVKKMTLIK